jgi:hypothetical protein
MAIEVNEQDKPRKGGKRRVTLSEKEQLDLGLKVTSNFDQMTAQRIDWINERNIDVKAFFGIKKKSEWPFKGASKISSQFHRIAVDTVCANMLKSMRGPEQPIKASATNSDSLENARYVEDLQNAQAKHEYNLFGVLDKALPNALVESYTVLKPQYVYETNEVMVDVTRWVPKSVNEADLSYDLDTDSVIVASTGEVVQSIDTENTDIEDEDLRAADMKQVEFAVTKEECLHDGWKVFVLGASRFFMPVFAPGETPFEKVQRSPYVAQQLFYTHDEVVNLGHDGYFDNTDAVSAECYDRARELLTQLKIEQTGFNLDSQVQKEMVEVVEWHGKYAFGKNAHGKPSKKLREVIVWVARASGQVLRVEMNDMGIRPFFPLVPFPVDDTPWGESLCKMMRPLVAELDLLISTIINISLMKAAPPKFYDPASGFNPDGSKSIGPNSWIPAREPTKNVYIPPQPEDPAVGMQMIQLLMNLIERLTSVNEVVQGQVSDRANTTATEVSQALVRSGVRFDMLYERLKGQMAPMFKYIHKGNLRCLPMVREMQYMGSRAKGEDGQSTLLTIHKGQLAGDFNFELAGNSVVTEQNELNKAVTLFNTVGQHPYLAYKPESIYYMLFNIVKHLNPIAMDKILPTPQEVQTLLRDRQEVQNEQEGMAQEQMQGQQQEAEIQMQMAQQQLQMEQQKHEMDMQAKQMDLQIKQKEAEIDLQAKQAEHQLKLQQAQQAHELKMKQMEEQNALAKKKAAETDRGGSSKD